MKKTILLFASALMLFASCSENDKVVLHPEQFVASEWIKGENNSIFENGDKVVLLRDDAEQLFDTLRWTPADFGYSAAVTYDIQVAKNVEGETSGYITVATTNKAKYGVTVKDFNSWLVSSGAVKGLENDMSIRVLASISSNYNPIVSEVYHFSANVFSTDPDRLYFVPVDTESLEANEFALSPDFNHEYRGFVNIPAGANGVWLVEDTELGVRYGIEASDAQGSKLVLKAEADGGRPIMPGAFGTGDIENSFVAEGYYRVDVKLTDEVKEIELWRFFGDFFICGQQRDDVAPWWNNGFSKQNPKASNGTGALLTYCPDERLWRSAPAFVPKNQKDGVKLWDFKFRANHSGSWLKAVNGGGNKNDSFDSGTGIQSGAIVLDGQWNMGKANNIQFLGEEGWYYWELDLSNYPDFTYRLVPTEKPAE
ncbi:MAG: SusE domain-containing protein [Candidatus Cryptobacteroides sp.]